MSGFFLLHVQHLVYSGGCFKLELRWELAEVWVCHQLKSTTMILEIWWGWQGHHVVTWEQNKVESNFFFLVKGKSLFFHVVDLMNNKKKKTAHNILQVLKFQSKITGTPGLWSMQIADIELVNADDKHSFLIAPANADSPLGSCVIPLSDSCVVIDKVHSAIVPGCFSLNTSTRIKIN